MTTRLRLVFLISFKIARAFIEYDPSKKLGITASSTKLITNHEISLSEKLLFPGTVYYYQVISKDASGNQAKSDVSSFKTKGSSVSIKVLGNDGKPLVGVKVKLIPGSEEATTDENGIATFNNLSPGEHSVQVEVGGQVLAEKVTVDESAKPDETQNLQVKIAALSSEKQRTQDFMKYTVIFFLGAVCASLISGLLWWRLKKKNR